MNGSGEQIEFDDNDGAENFSCIERECDVNALPAGTYYAKVDDYGNNDVIDLYTLTFTATPCRQTDSQVRAFVRRFYQNA